MLKRTRSQLSLSTFLNSETNRQDLQSAFATAADLLLAQHVNALLGKTLIFKQHDQNTALNLLTKNTMLPLTEKTLFYTESHPEKQYQKRLLSFLDFLRISGPSLPASTFYAVLQRVIDEFRPALLLQLFHPHLQQVNNEQFLFRLINYLRSDFCHWRLIGVTVQMQQLLKNKASSHLIALKIRKFFIPLYGLLGSFDSAEPEINRELKKLLENKRVVKILQEIKCQADEIPTQLQEGAIPTLLEFRNEPEFLEITSEKSQLNKFPPSLPTPTPDQTYKELAIRRCCSQKDLKSLKPSNQETMLNALVSNQSILARAILTGIEKDIVDQTYPEIQTAPQSDQEENESPLYLRCQSIDSGSSGNNSFNRRSTFREINISLKKGFEGEEIDEQIKQHPFFSDFNYFLSIENVIPNPREWTTLKENRDLTVMAKPLLSKTLYMVKAYAHIYFDIPVIEQALNSQKQRKRWDQVTNYQVLDIEDTHNVIYWRISSMVGITDREVVLKKAIIKDYPTKGAMMVHITSTEHRSIPENEKAARAKIIFGGIVLHPEEEKTSANVILKVEVGGILPQQMVFKYFEKNLSDWFQQLNIGCSKVENRYQQEYKGMFLML